MKFEAGTYSRNSENYNPENLAKVAHDMREYTDKNFQKAEQERRLARLGVLELRARGVI